MAAADDPQTDPSAAPAVLEETRRPHGPETDARADEIIRTHMTYSMIGSAIPVPLLDLTALTAVQLDMIKQLAKVYAVAFDSRAARSFMASLGSALAGRWLARLAGVSLAKLIPGLGQLAGAAAGVYLNGAFTYATGTLIKSHFAAGRPLAELDARSVKDEFTRLFELGRERASALLDKVRRDKGKGRKGGTADEAATAAEAGTADENATGDPGVPEEGSTP
jgi:uncharacterized protein (DUF697 family)